MSCPEYVLNFTRSVTEVDSAPKINTLRQRFGVSNTFTGRVGIEYLTVLGDSGIPRGTSCEEFYDIFNREHRLN